MNGEVDEQNRALVQVEVRASLGASGEMVDAWIDTAFDGHFVFSSNLVKELGLDTLVETDPILADGSKVALQTYVCYLDWFGDRIAAQVIENEGRFPLLGTALMHDLRLVVDYARKTVELFKAT